jgi:hypothetical protein
MIGDESRRACERSTILAGIPQTWCILLVGQRKARVPWTRTEYTNPRLTVEAAIHVESSGHADAGPCLLVLTCAGLSRPVCRLAVRRADESHAFLGDSGVDVASHARYQIRSGTKPKRYVGNQSYATQDPLYVQLRQDRLQDALRCRTSSDSLLRVV